EHPLTTHHPQIEFQRLLANLTPNDSDQKVPVIGWEEDKCKERNAEWGVEAYFTPRTSVSPFPHAKLVAFYTEGKGMVVLLHCFDNPNKIPKFLEFLPTVQSSN